MKFLLVKNCVKTVKNCNIKKIFLQVSNKGVFGAEIAKNFLNSKALDISEL